MTSSSAGYLHRLYAESFSELATPLHLPGCDGWLLERRIPGSELDDAMGCYPLFACRDWSRVGSDLEALGSNLVSVTLVADPFGNYAEHGLRTVFDLVRPFKRHYVTDLEIYEDHILTRNRRRNIARARARVRVETCTDRAQHLDEWVDLYAGLIERHRITGVAAFSRASLARQLAVPGLLMLRATVDDDPVGVDLWYVQGDVAYSHLGATSDLGYKLGASYALLSHAIEELRGRVRWLDLGGSAGLDDDEAGSGLSRFKERWATGTRTAYLCGRVLQPERYAQLSQVRGTTTASYFPAYRAGEFGRRRRPTLSPSNG